MPNVAWFALLGGFISSLCICKYRSSSPFPIATSLKPIDIRTKYPKARTVFVSPTQTVEPVLILIPKL